MLLWEKQVVIKGIKKNGRVAANCSATSSSNFHRLAPVGCKPSPPWHRGLISLRCSILPRTFPHPFNKSKDTSIVNAVAHWCSIEVLLLQNLLFYITGEEAVWTARHAWHRKKKGVAKLKQESIAASKHSAVPSDTMRKFKSHLCSPLNKNITHEQDHSKSLIHKSTITTQSKCSFIKQSWPRR